MPELCILFAGGGTGGHLFPAIAIADELRSQQPAAEIHFVGTKDRIEARVVPQLGYAFHSIWISGFRRSFRLSNLLFPLKVIVSFMQSVSIIRKIKPNVVVGTGGYVSGPVLRAAVLCNIPTLIQEQNSYPGVTTRMLAPKVDEVHVTFESSLQYLSGKSNIHVSGNPTRNMLAGAEKKEALNYFGFDEKSGAVTLLVVGGSLGAHSINTAVIGCLERLVGRGLRIIWQTGKEDLRQAVEAAGPYPDSTIWVSSFIDRMDYAYAAADVVLCRAGATSLAELTRLGKPSILVPYPHAAADHQTENARALASAGAAIVLPDDAAGAGLEEAVVSLLDPKRRSEMSKASAALGRPEAAAEIAQRVLSLAGKR